MNTNLPAFKPVRAEDNDQNSHIYGELPHYPPVINPGGVAQSRKKRAARRGYVYLLRADKYFKLGLSDNPKARYREIQTLLPFPVSTVHLIATSDMLWVEKYWHDLYDAKRCYGEWFILSDDDVNHFCSHVEMEPHQ